jgi:hypothetical protein
MNRVFLLALLLIFLVWALPRLLAWLNQPKEQVSRSEDEVSKALAPIFGKAVSHSPEDVERARLRRELRNPPGKISNALGDQLTWERSKGTQGLCRFFI